MSRGTWKRRAYEITALAAARQSRVMYLFWTRRGRKSTTLGAMAFDVMSAKSGTSVIAASASLLVGAELVSMTMSAAEQAIQIRQEADALRDTLTNCAEGGGAMLVAANSETGKTYANISGDDYADLYRSKRLEFRLYFDKTRYSRLLVIAPNPATARGWGGCVFRDEQQFTHPELERDLQTATDPIIDTDPTFRLVYASNLCGDDRHPGYEMTMPREPMQFEPCPQGHFYISQTGILVHRVDLADAYAAGHTLFDKKTGEPMSLEKSLSGMTPTARKCNYMLVHEPSGTAAVSAISLHTAQQRGLETCRLFYIDRPQDMNAAAAWLADHIVPKAPTGLGFDVATTTKGLSNPSALTITQTVDGIHRAVAVLVWKERDPVVARSRVMLVIGTCKVLGAPARMLCIDASNERYFAEETRQKVEKMVPCLCISNGANVEPMPAGYERAVNYKTYLGDLYTAAINENLYALPPEPYLKKDHRSVVKDSGTYNADVDNDGGHGDTFDGCKLAHYALHAPIETSGTGEVFENTRAAAAVRARADRSCIG